METANSPAVPALLVAVAHAEARATWAAELEKLKGQELAALAALSAGLAAASRVLPAAATSSLKAAIREALVRADVVGNSTRQAFAMTDAASDLDPDSVTRALRNEVRLKAARVVLLGTLAAKLDARVAAAQSAGTIGCTDGDAASSSSAVASAPASAEGGKRQQLPFRICGASSSILFGPHGHVPARGSTLGGRGRASVQVAALAAGESRANAATIVALEHAGESLSAGTVPTASTHGRSPEEAWDGRKARGSACAADVGLSAAIALPGCSGTGQVATASTANTSWQPGRAEHLTVAQRAVLSAWLQANLHHPYPSAADKNALASAAGTTVERVSNWCVSTSEGQPPCMCCMDTHDMLCLPLPLLDPFPSGPLSLPAFHTVA